VAILRDLEYLKLQYKDSTMPVKHYKPGTPEFEDVAKTITHISRVPRRDTDSKLWIDADKGPNKSHRNETVDKLR
jgi:hypothetical protein